MSIDKQKLLIYSYARTRGLSIGRYLDNILIDSTFVNEIFNFYDDYSIRKNDFNGLEDEKRNINKLFINLKESNILGFRHNIRNFSHSSNWFELDKHLIEKFSDQFILVLERDNVLNSAISLELARNYGTWNVTDEGKEFNKKVELNINNIEKHVEINSKKWQKRKDFIKSETDNFKILKYEDFYLEKSLNEKIEYFNTILNNLNGNYKTVFWTFDKKGKINNKPYEEKIKNYNEIKQKFS